MNQIHLQHAFLFRAILSYANLSDADLLGADLSYAKLSDAKLSHADLSNANLSNTILVHNEYEQSINTNTNFNNAIIDNPEYIKYLHRRGGRNIPNEIKSKQELRSLLEKRNLNENVVNYILSPSDLQWKEIEKQGEKEWWETGTA